MSIFKQFKTDAKKEAEGVKVEYSPNKDGSIPSVTIRRAGKSNKRYSKALEAATRPYRRQIELGTMADETAEKLLKGVFVDTVVIGWEHIQPNDDGIELPFTRENVLRVLEELPEWYDDLQKQSNSVVLFRDEAMEDEAKN